MKKSESLFYHILLFSIAQFVWCLLLGLWIFWYVTYFLKTDAITATATGALKNTGNVIVLVSGIILLVTLSTILSLIFAYLAKQMNLTSLYDNFISNVTHELKSPLSSIQLFLETMYKREIGREKEKEFLKNMLSDVERLNKLINSILYLSTMKYAKTARKLIHDYHVYNADSIIREVLGEVLKSYRIPEGQYRIEGEASCRCVVDRNWLAIVFGNLVDNAIKYSLKTPFIDIRIAKPDKYFTVEIRDNGIGIEKKDYKKIFRRFLRLENPESPNVRGTGLGLYRVKEIVEYHGGWISVHSGGRHHGTSFTIHLPVYRSSRNRHIYRLLKLSRREKKFLSEGGGPERHE